MPLSFRSIQTELRLAKIGKGSITRFRFQGVVLWSLALALGNSLGPAAAGSAAECGHPIALVRSGNELLTTDGTRSGTVKLLKLDGEIGAVGPFQEMGGVARSLLLDIWTKSTSQLWTTNGTPAGTRVMRRLTTVDGPPSLTGFTPIGRRALFSSEEPHAFESQLWTTDGTSADTRLIASVITPQLPGSARLTGGPLIFEAYGGVWATRGTAASTILIQGGTIYFSAGSMTSLGNQVLFEVVNNGVTQIWRTDGTSAGTVLAVSLPGQTPPGGTLHSIGTRALLAYGSALWFTDGTPSGTLQVPGISYPDVAAVARIGSRFVFAAYEGLFVTDGTVSGTTLIKPSGAGPGVFLPLLSSGVARIGDKVLFAGADGTRPQNPGVTYPGKINQLWITDGTPSGTHRIATLPAEYDGPGILSFIDLGDRVLVPDLDGSSAPTFVTDGTAAGTSKLFDAVATIGNGTVIGCPPVTP